MSQSGDDWLNSNTPPTSAGAQLAASEDSDGADDGARACSQCESPLDSDQLYCLECGTPTDIAPRITSPAKFGPLIVAGLIGLGLVGGGVAFAVLQDGDSGSGETGAAVTSVDTTATEAATEIPATTDGGLPPDPAAPTTNDDGVFDPSQTEANTDGFEDPTDTAVTDPVPTPTDSTPTETATSDWPTGTTGWTVFVSSVTDGAEAVGTRQRVEALGEEAGLLFSSDHEGLNPGFWVVYSGVYDTRAEAVDQADSLRVDFPGANPRRVVS